MPDRKLLPALRPALTVAPLLIYRALSGGLSLLVGVVIAATWGLRELAAYTVANSFIAIGAVITDWGSSRSMPRDLAVAAPDGARSIVASLNAIRLSVAALFAAVLAIAIACGALHLDSVRYAVLLSPLLILNPLAINGVSVRIVRSESLAFAWAVALNIGAVVAVSIAGAPLLGGASLALGLVAGKVAECAALIGRRMWLLRMESRDLFSVALRVLPFSAQYIFGTIYSRVPVFVAASLASREAVGVLGAATTIQGVLLILPTSIALFRFPALTVAVRDGMRSRIRQVIDQYLLLSVLAILGSAALVALAMPWVAPRLHIPAASEPFVLVYALCALPTVGILIATVMLQARRNEAVAARISAVTLLAAIVLQWGSVSRFGLWGAAAALLASEILSLCLYAHAARRLRFATADSAV